MMRLLRKRCFRSRVYRAEGLSDQVMVRRIRNAELGGHIIYIGEATPKNHRVDYRPAYPSAFRDSAVC